MVVGMGVVGIQRCDHISGGFVDFDSVFNLFKGSMVMVDKWVYEVIMGSVHGEFTCVNEGWKVSYEGGWPWFNDRWSMGDGIIW